MGSAGSALRRMWCDARVAVAMLLLVVSGAASAQTSPLQDGWNNASCSGCHGTPSITSDDGNYSNILGANFLSPQVADGQIVTRLRNWCSTAPGSGGGQGTTMCTSYSSYLTNSTTTPDADLKNVYYYLIAAREAAVSATSLTFGATAVNPAVPPTQTITLSNYRDTAITVSLGASSSADFTRSHNCPSNQIPAANAATGAPGTCTVTVTFDPGVGSATTRSGSFGISFTSTGATPAPNPASRTISLSGTVLPAGFGFSAGTTTFTSRVNSAFSVDVGTVTNTGNASFTLSAIGLVASVPNATYNVVTTGGGVCAPPVVLDKNASCTVRISYTPGAATVTNPTLRLTYSGGSVSPAGPRDVALQGTGVQPLISPTTASLNLGSVQQGASSLPQTVVLTNTGSMPFTFLADPKALAARSGANPSDFAVTTSCSSGVGNTVANGSDCTISVTFNPPLAAPAGVPRTATLTVSTDADNNGGVLSVSLTGTPVTLPEPTLAVNPATDFPDTVIGQSSSPTTRQIVVTNPRTHAISYSFPAQTDFQTVSQVCSSGSPPTVPANGGTCTITMAFAPAVAGGETRRTASIPFTFTGSGGDPNPAALNAALAGRALLPLGAPTSLAPNAGVGIPGTTSTLLSNRSVSPITLSALAFSGAAAAEYTLDATNGCAVGANIAVGGSCTLVVRFDPVAGGTRNATLTVTHNALGSPQAITLNGSATQGAIQLSSFALSFGDTALNATTAQSVTVGNNGTQALNFSAFDLAGAASGDYTRSGDCAVGTPLAVGAQCTVTITFHPTTLGTRTASLTIQSDASNGPATVTLTGNGVPIPAPQVALTPTGLDFGTQTVGNLYPARTIRLSNAGNADLHTTSVVVEGGAFATSSTCPATLAPGAGCDVQIQFAPLLANTDYTGALRVVSDAPGSPHTAALAGRGSIATLAALTWSPLVAALDFGTVSSGTLSATQTATLLNQGPGGVTLTVLNAVGADANAFAVTGGTCAVGAALFEGQSCTVVVQFAPSQAGARQAQLQVASTGSFPPALALTGTGLGGPTPDVALSVATMDLGPTRVGAQSAPGEITLSSTGSGSLRVTAFAVDGPFTVQAKTCPALPFTLPAGAACTLGVSFVPQAQGGAAGALKITTSASATPTEVALSGQGDAAPDLSSGGCSIASGDTLTDPTLWALAALAALLLWRRRRADRAGSPRR